MSTKDVSTLNEIQIEQLNAEFSKIIRKVLNPDSLHEHFARDDKDALSECWVAYLENHKIEDVWNHLREWQHDRYVSRSDRSLSVNWLPTAPRKDGRVGYTVRSRDGHIVDMGDTQGGRWYDRRSLKMWENNDKYEVEYQFDNGWPGTGGPKEGGIYLYRRPYTDNMKACAYRVGYSVCDLLSQDMQGKPEYYMVGDICWECYLARGIDPIRLSVAWLWLLDAAFSEGLLTHSQAIAYFHVLTSYHAGLDYQIAALLRTKRPAVTRLLGRIEKKYQNFFGLNLRCLSF